MSIPRAERALIRLEQLAREERAAIAAEDVGMLCHVCTLLPDAEAKLEAAGVDGIAGIGERLAEIRSAHEASETFLTKRMADTMEALRQFGGVRRTMRGYGAPSRQNTGRVSSEV